MWSSRREADEKRSSSGNILKKEAFSARSVREPGRLRTHRGNKGQRAESGKGSLWR
jgi:hypothetical protein